MAKSRIGDVVWGAAVDARGHIKSRPMIVIGVEPQLENRRVCVCITSSPPRRDYERFIPLPWTESGRSLSGLTKASWAALDWLVEINERQIERIAGRLSAHLMRQIIDGVERG